MPKKLRKTILITGGAGFIGSHLCKILLAQNHIVISFDNLSTGSLENIKIYKQNKNFMFINGDVTSDSDLNLSEHIDEIYNLACPASPVQYQKDPINTIKTNVLGAVNVLELAKRNKARILQASTSEVYGDPDEHPQKESYWGNVNPLGPRSCYDEGKRCAESLFNNYKLQYGVDIRIARIFNTYGPNMSLDDGRVISNFIVNSLQNKPLEISGNGLQTRSFQFIDDLIDGFLKLMARDDYHTPVNIGNPDEHTVLDMAHIISRMCGTKNNIKFNKPQEDDPKKRKPDISLASELLDWQPKISLEEGLSQTIEYFKLRLSST